MTLNRLSSPHRIADLGITRVLQRIDSLTNRGTMTMCGTPIYLAPECAAGEAFTASRDVYAWGSIIKGPS